MTSLAAAERSTAIRWETSQFSGSATGTAGDPTRLSARAAYQLLLHRRAVLIDLRPEAQRLAEGEVDPALRPVVLESDDLEGPLDPGGAVGLAPPEMRVLVLGGARYASALAPGVAIDIVGGLVAWREAGLPLAERAAT